MSSIFLHHRNVGIGCCNKCCQCPTHIFQHCLHAYSFCPGPVLNSLPEDLSTHTEAGHKYWGVTAPGNYPQPMMKGNWLMNSPISSPLMTEVEGNLQIWSWSKQPQCHLGAHLFGEEGNRPNTDSLSLSGLSGETYNKSCGCLGRGTRMLNNR